MKIDIVQVWFLFVLFWSVVCWWWTLDRVASTGYWKINSQIINSWLSLCFLVSMLAFFLLSVWFFCFLVCLFCAQCVFLDCLCCVCFLWFERKGQATRQIFCIFDKIYICRSTLSMTSMTGTSWSRMRGELLDHLSTPKYRHILDLLFKVGITKIHPL